MLFAYLTPLLVFYALSGASREHLYILLLSVGLIFALKNGRLFRFPPVENGSAIALVIIIVGILVTITWMILSGGIKYFNLDLDLIYVVRNDVSDTINIGPMSYINSWATGVFSPLLIALLLWKKKYVPILFVLGLHVFWFGINSSKGVLFYPFLVISLWLFSRTSMSFKYIPIVMSSFILISLYTYFTFDNGFIGSLLIRRMFFVPSVLTFTYYDFFSINSFVYWSNSFTTSWFIEYPYLQNTARVISAHLGVDNGYASNSFFSTGYMHAGVPGMILYGIIFGLILRIIDSISNAGLPRWLSMAVIFVPIQGLILSSDILTSLLTHGLGISIFLLILMRRKKSV